MYCLCSELDFCSSAVAAGNLMHTALVDYLFTKVLGGALASSIIIL